MLDGESRKGNSSGGSSPEALVEKIKAQHYGSPRYFEVTSAKVSENFNQNLNRLFGIRHFVADVIYDTSHFLEANSDRLCDDIVAVFHKSHCSFGFVSHLFGSELRQLQQANNSHANHSDSGTGSVVSGVHKPTSGVLPRGLKFRVAPTASHTSHHNNGSELPSTLTADFHNRLDNLLRTLVHARPHFVRCIKLNDGEKVGVFERSSVARQVRALQILETVNLMAGGLPHRMRFKAFSARYRLLVKPSKLLARSEEKLVEDCNLILEHFEGKRTSLSGVYNENGSNSAASVSCVLGKKHIFLSESARQQLELVRTGRRVEAAILVQAAWRGFKVRRQWSEILKSHRLFNARLTNQKKAYLGTNSSVLNGNQRPARPQPITGTPPPPVANYHQIQSTLPLSSPSKGQPQQNPTPSVELCDFNMVRETCALFGIDLATPPPLPPSRSYSISGAGSCSLKCHFPQLRTLRADYVDPGGSGRPLLGKGQQVLVLGNAPGRRGFFAVKHCAKYSNVLEVPHQFFEPLLANTLPNAKLGTLCI